MCLSEDFVNLTSVKKKKNKPTLVRVVFVFFFFKLHPTPQYFRMCFVTWGMQFYSINPAVLLIVRMALV